MTDNQRVLLRRDHPWAGYTGTVVGRVDLAGGLAYEVRLDNGHTCIAWPGDVRFLLGERHNDV